MLDSSNKDSTIEWDSPITKISGVSHNTAEKYTSSTVGELISSDETLNFVQINWFWDAATDILQVNSPCDVDIEIQDKFQTISRAESLDPVDDSELPLVRRLSPSEEYHLRPLSSSNPHNVEDVIEVSESFKAKPFDGRVVVIKTSSGRQAICPSRVLELSESLFGENSIEKLFIVKNQSSWECVVRSDLGLELVVIPDWDFEDGQEWQNYISL